MSSPAPNREAFRQAPESGLYVPEALSRTVQKWTKQEWRLMERWMKLAQSRGLRFAIRCEMPRCPDPTPKATRLPSGDLRLRCGCTDRILSQDF